MTYLAGKHGIYNVEVVKTITKKGLVVAFRDEPDNMDRFELLRQLLED